MRILNHTRSLIFIALFAALMVAGAYIRIPVGPVPITMQTAFAVMAGLTLGAWRGSAAMVIYIALGLFGLPVFTAGGGFGYALYPTFGYIVGFVFCAFLSGLLFKLSKNKTPLAGLIAGLAGLLAVYIVGLPYFYLIKTLYLDTPVALDTLFISGFLIFLPGDIVTAALAAFLAVKLKRIVR